MRAEKRKKKRKALLVILAIVAVFVLGTGGYAYYLWHKAASTVASIHERIDKSKKEILRSTSIKKTRFPS